jgi:hypothetical protein
MRLNSEWRSPTLKVDFQDQDEVAGAAGSGWWLATKVKDTGSSALVCLRYISPLVGCVKAPGIDKANM